MYFSNACYLIMVISGISEKPQSMVRERLVSPGKMPD